MHLHRRRSPIFCVWVNGQFRGDRGELLSFFEPLESFLSLGLGVRYDDLEADLATSGLLRRKTAKGDIEKKCDEERCD